MVIVFLVNSHLPWRLWSQRSFTLQGVEDRETHNTTIELECIKTGRLEYWECHPGTMKNVHAVLWGRQCTTCTWSPCLKCRQFPTNNMREIFECRIWFACKFHLYIHQVKEMVILKERVRMKGTVFLVLHSYTQYIQYGALIAVPSWQTANKKNTLASYCYRLNSSPGATRSYTSTWPPDHTTSNFLLGHCAEEAGGSVATTTGD